MRKSPASEISKQRQQVRIAPAISRKCGEPTKKKKVRGVSRRLFKKPRQVLSPPARHHAVATRSRGRDLSVIACAIALSRDRLIKVQGLSGGFAMARCDDAIAQRPQKRAAANLQFFARATGEVIGITRPFQSDRPFQTRFKFGERRT